MGGRARERGEDHKSAHLSLLTMTTVAHSRELEQRLLRIYDHGDRALNLVFISAIWVSDNNSQIGLSVLLSMMGLHGSKIKFSKTFNVATTHHHPSERQFPESWAHLSTKVIKIEQGKEGVSEERYPH